MRTFIMLVGRAEETVVLRQQRNDSSQASGAVSKLHQNTASPFTVHPTENINTLIVITVLS